MDKALAAVGDEPVLHVVLEYQLGERVDLRTGQTEPVRYQAEIWYDAARHVYRTESQLDGRVVYHTQGTGNLGSEPFLLSDLYRRALEQGKLHQTGETTIRGTPALVVEAEQPNGTGLFRAYLDARSYRLLRMQFLQGGALQSQMDVLQYETVSREEAHLPQPTPGPVPSAGVQGGSMSSSGGGSSGGTLTPDQARSAFSTPALWPGRSLDGHALSSIQIEDETQQSGDRSAKGRKLLLQYGPGGKFGSDPYLEIEEAPAASPLWTVGTVHAPPPGYVDLTSGETSDGKTTRTQWTGSMQQDGFVLQLTSYDRETLIAAARALQPLP